jgi:hypothetical protein
MKSRQKELLNRSIQATVAAIEIYNKPSFLYRDESFAVLLINGWELLIKAKWLSENKNDIRSLYIRDKINKKDGTKGKKLVYKLTRSKSFKTQGLEQLTQKLLSKNKIHLNVWKNIEGLIEIRDTAVHFFHNSPGLSLKLQELGTASIRNYAAVMREWFDEDLSDYNLFLMPLAFISPPKKATGIVTNKDEKNLLDFIEKLKPKNHDINCPYRVCVTIDVKFERSKSAESTGLRITNSDDAIKVTLTEEDFREMYPMDHRQLTEECRRRYIGFKEDPKFNAIKKTLRDNPNFAKVHYLDSKNPMKSQKKTFYGKAIFSELDKHYKQH